MREATNGKYPRYIVWENVPGAFSSNHGEDFRCVLENICRIKDEDVSVPKPLKWNHAGLVMGDGYSVAWRVLDAQYWGVPQRRKRIYLVADLDGGSAGKILFESEGMSWNPCKGRETWQETAGDIGESPQATGWCLNDQGGDRMNLSKEAYDKYTKNSVSSSLRASGGAYGGGSEALVYTMSKNSHHTKAKENLADTLVATDYKDPPYVIREPKYIVRRLTPTECARLQGFPDDWCDDLGTEDPTEEEMIFWRDVFETHRKIVTHASKPKTDNQIMVKTAIFRFRCI